MQQTKRNSCVFRMIARNRNHTLLDRQHVNWLHGISSTRVIMFPQRGSRQLDDRSGRPFLLSDARYAAHPGMSHPTRMPKIHVTTSGPWRQAAFPGRCPPEDGMLNAGGRVRLYAGGRVRLCFLYACVAAREPDLRLHGLRRKDAAGAGLLP